MTTTSPACLILHPDKPDWFPENLETLINCLLSTGLVSENIKNMNQCYFAGDKFLDLITFMGCSPSISFTPDKTSDKFSFIRLITTPDEITTLTSKHTYAPHCPGCKKAVKDWRRRITVSELKCPMCGETSLPWHYNWRKSAGFGRLFIEITEIYPKEAIPQQSLLDQLKNELGVEWKYFYYYN